MDREPVCLFVYTENGRLMHKDGVESLYKQTQLSGLHTQPGEKDITQALASLIKKYSFPAESIW